MGSRQELVLIINVLLLVALLLIGNSSLSAEPKTAQRIIALSPHSVEMLFAIGAGDRIIATISSADYPAAAQDIERIANHNAIVIEKVIALKPDLIIGWSGGNKLNQLAQLKRLGFKVINSDPQSLADIASDIRKLGKLTGLTDQAQSLANDYEQRLAAIIVKYQAREKVRVFYQLWSKPLMTISNKSWLNQFINGCGGINVFNDADTAYPQISIENVLLAKPQALLIPKDELTRGHDLVNWQQWQHLDAVKNNHIYFPNGTLLHRPTTRILTAMAEMCEQIDKVRN
jgi:vitamin B12 transport system substrate-binding protein